MTDLTPKQAQVLAILAAASDPLYPSQIGQRAGKPYRNASSWANGALNALRDRRLVHYPPGGPCSPTELGWQVSAEAAPAN